MKKIFGFIADNVPETEVKNEVEPEICRPVKSLVSIRFQGVYKPYTYYNDLFDLAVGDAVYVTGKLAGHMGIVESVNTKFKINLKNYEKVIANPKIQFKGTYFPVMDKMVSYDPDATDAEAFRQWVIAPENENDPPEIVFGEGYSFQLDKFEDSPDVDTEVLHRAVEYCEEGRVCYLSICDGVGTAFIEGSVWYEVNFRFEDGIISDMYCDCPYPKLCKHNIAVLITLRALLKKLSADKENFTAIDQNFFFKMLTFGKQSITMQ